MNRRGFFTLLSAAAIAPLVPVPELLLPTRTIFLPPRGGWVTAGRYDVVIDVGPEHFSRISMFEEARRIQQQMLMGSQWPPYLLQVSNDGGQTFRDVRPYAFNRIAGVRRP